MRRAALIAMMLVAGVASAQPGTPKDPSRPPPGWKPPKIEMGPMAIGGDAREAQVMFMLERAFSELERSSLPRRSFIPELVRTLDEEAL